MKGMLKRTEGDELMFFCIGAPYLYQAVLPQPSWQILFQVARVLYAAPCIEEANLPQERNGCNFALGHRRGFDIVR